jgi:hypothetical protein
MTVAGWIRTAVSFAQANLSDQRGLGVHAVAHSPARVALPGDYHVHLVATARKIGRASMGEFARDLLGNGGQTMLYEEWLSHRSNLPYDLV